MAGDSQNWVLSVTAQTPTNIAVIKYWGKRDETLILPVNDSISVTLDPAHLCTTTTVAVSPAFHQDRMWLNGKEISLSGGRFQSCLREIRSRACDVESKEKGIKIAKKDWEKLHVHIASYNNFPTAAGLASSAAGFACLVFALGKLMNVKENQSELSAIARQGSGSACRSLYGGFVKWIMGKEEDGTDSLAVQLADEKHWDDLVIIIAVVSSRQKETSSTSGMRDSVETSLLLQHRAKEVVPKRILEMEEAIKNCDFASFAQLTCCDSNQFHAVCLDTCPPIFYMNDTSHRIISFVEKWNRSEETPQVAYTFDAGPNAVLIARNRNAAANLLQRLLFHFPPNPDTDLNSYVIGDKSILQDAGINGMKDIEALPSPLEVKNNIPAQKYTGEVSYFICTRPGRGPVVLSDESQALLNPETGMPNTSDSSAEDELINELEKEVIAELITMQQQPRHRRRWTDRGRQEGHERLVADYFAMNPLYNEDNFRRRFRMRRHLFNKIVDALADWSPYFCQRPDVTGKPEFSTLQKCTAAIRMLAYGGPADAVDEYIRMGETTAIECLTKFVRGINAVFGEDYLRKPNADDVQRLLQLGERRGFPGMLGSIDCMHWQWKNCPVAWKGQFTKGDHGVPTIMLEAVASQDLWIWHAFFGVAGSNNDINVLNQSTLFTEAFQRRDHPVHFTVNGHQYSSGYYLADGIYPEWASFVKTIPLPQTDKHKLFATCQEATRKDVERAFGVLQAQFEIVAGPVRIWKRKTIADIMHACIILHNMIVEDERDTYQRYQEYVYEGSNSTRPTTTVNHGPTEDFSFLLQTDREIRDRTVHRRLKNDLVEHIWEHFRGT